MFALILFGRRFWAVWRFARVVVIGRFLWRRGLRGRRFGTLALCGQWFRFGRL